jgi:hypothetical protein
MTWWGATFSALRVYTHVCILGPVSACIYTLSLPGTGIAMGMVVWQGLSQLDGVTPIVVIATGLDSSSANEKTGGMVQTFILRADIEPHTAIADGADEAICGVCPHRGKASGGTGACYVRVYQAPLSTWRAWQRGNAESFDLGRFAGKRVRIGSYGDPAAVPVTVWQDIVAVAEATTGYTHQWRTCDPAFAEFCMASTDSVAERRQARLKGYRTFHVRALGTAKSKGEIVCPASAEAGKRTTCASCLQCGGTGNGRTADITILAHGASKRAFAALGGVA